jgi:hypothetical protein
LNKDNLCLLNKDFRIARKEEIPNDSVDLVLVLDFRAPGRVYAQIDAGKLRVAPGKVGFLAMQVEQRFFTTNQYSKGHVCLQFYHHLSVHLASSLDRFGEQKIQLNKKELTSEKTYQFGSDRAT